MGFGAVFIEYDQFDKLLTFAKQQHAASHSDKPLLDYLIDFSRNIDRYAPQKVFGPEKIGKDSGQNTAVFTFGKETLMVSKELYQILAVTDENSLALLIETAQRTATVIEQDKKEISAKKFTSDKDRQTALNEARSKAIRPFRDLFDAQEKQNKQKAEDMFLEFGVRCSDLPMVVDLKQPNPYTGAPRKWTEIAELQIKDPELQRYVIDGMDKNELHPEYDKLVLDPIKETNTKAGHKLRIRRNIENKYDSEDHMISRILDPTYIFNKQRQIGKYESDQVGGHELRHAHPDQYSDMQDKVPETTMRHEREAMLYERLFDTRPEKERVYRDHYHFVIEKPRNTESLAIADFVDTYQAIHAGIAYDQTPEDMRTEFKAALKTLQEMAEECGLDIKDIERYARMDSDIKNASKHAVTIKAEPLAIKEANDVDLNNLPHLPKETGATIKK